MARTCLARPRALSTSIAGPHPSSTPPRPRAPPPPADGTSFVCASHDKLAILREGLTGNWRTTLEGHKGAVWSAKLDRTESLVATGAADCTARLWSLYSEDGSPSTPANAFKHELVHKQVVRSVEFSPVRGTRARARLALLRPRPT